MRKVWLFVSSVLLILALCGCYRSTEPYTVEKNYLTFEINPEAKTVFDGTDTYSYTISENDSGYRITITYPDGSTYTESKRGSHITGSTSKDYDQYRYLDGATLCSVLSEEIQHTSSPVIHVSNIFAGILCIGVGVFHICSPYAHWYWTRGRWFKNAEPSDWALKCTQIGGIVFVVLGVLLFFLI